MKYLKQKVEIKEIKGDDDAKESGPMPLSLTKQTYLKSKRSLYNNFKG